MLDQLASAVQNEDYSAANELLRELQQEDPTNPWISFYSARLQEAEGFVNQAHQAYLSVLRTSTHPKIMTQARLGIKRIEQLQQNQQEIADNERQAALEAAMNTPESQEMGLLILEKIPNEEKQTAAQKFAEIMKIDAYSARLQLPSRSWRLYRTGAIGKLSIYAENLNKAGIPCFAVSIKQINRLNVYPVLFIESITPNITIVYQPQKGQRDILTFSWNQVSQRVEGMLPIFEECVDVGLRGKLERSIEILDYAKFCDLHLPQSQTILRFCDQTYQFHQGYSMISEEIVTEGTTTKRDYWNYFTSFINQNLPNKPVWSDFTPFGETTIDFAEILKQIDSHVNLLRREETPWDAAFALYSGLAFLKNKNA